MTVGIDEKLLRDQCRQTLAKTDFTGLGELYRGKVRDCYVADGVRTIVASDRVSCFDVVVGTIPWKGQILNQLAAFWFDRTQDVAPNHVIDVPDPNVTRAHEASLLPVEFVYRAYLTGVSRTSIWTEYERGARTYCGHALPDGMVKHQLLPEPLLTPTTKAVQGEHDELTSRAELIENGSISEDLYDAAAALGKKLFAAGQAWAESRGLILVDTKYEMGLDTAGELVVIDEIHTPDSSRYWYTDSYAAAMSTGSDPKSLDKEFVRRWLVERGYQGDGPSPELTDEVRCEAARRYIETYERLTGGAFEPNCDEPLARIEANLGLRRGL